MRSTADAAGHPSPQTKEALEQADAVADRNATLAVSVIAAGLFGILASTQAIFVLGLNTFADDLVAQGGDFLLRAGMNLMTVAVMAALTLLLAPQARGAAARTLPVLLIAAVCAVFRCAGQAVFGLLEVTRPLAVLAEGSSGFAVIVVALVLALQFADAQRRVRESERSRARQQLVAVSALEALQAEELRIRREVADGLHGSIQNSFVIIGAELRDLASHLAPRHADRLGAIVARLDALREKDVRALSRALYPVELRGGDVLSAVRTLLNRLPPSLSVDLVTDAVAWRRAREAGRELTEERAILFVRIIEEALSNALRHGGASSIRVQLDVLLAEEASGITGYRLVFEDNGSGGGVVEAGGLARMRVQLDLYGGTLTVGSSPLGGVRLEAVLPLP
ncbi:MAG: hypothetical protein QM604_04900 [Microbacterium sp.]